MANEFEAGANQGGGSLSGSLLSTQTQQMATMQQQASAQGVNWQATGDIQCTCEDCIKAQSGVAPAPSEPTIIPDALMHLTLTNKKPEVIGGKAAGLAKLMALGYCHVPSTWVIPCAHSVAPKRPKVSVDYLLPGGRLYAVRSGAPISMPGLLDTKLNVPLAKVPFAVEAVWDSWNSSHAKAYRDANGIDHNIGTAVVIQEMVKAAYAGVCFTNDPTNIGNENAFVPIIEYVQGLGDGLVGGTVTPMRLTGSFPRPYHKVAPTLRSQAEAIHKSLGPSDLEWVISIDGHLYWVQHRKLKFTEPAALPPDESGRKVIAKGRPIGAPQNTIAKLCNIEEGHVPGAAIYLEDFKPEYYQAMMKAPAIVTAHGGETCHAAIIARGMNKPAISGLYWGNQLHAYKDKLVLFNGATGTLSVALGHEAASLVQLVVQNNPTPPCPSLDVRKHIWQAEMLLWRFYSLLEKHRQGTISDVDYNARVLELATVMNSYHYIIACCEARHIRDCTNAFTDHPPPGHKEMAKELMVKLKPLGVTLEGPKPNRQGFLAGKVLQPENLAAAIKALELILEVYTKLQWNSSFGGAKWGTITAHALAYMRGEINATLYLDGCFNLQHNCGWAFGKFSWFGYLGNNPALGEMLNAKQESFETLSALVKPSPWKTQFAAYAEAESIYTVTAQNVEPAPKPPPEMLCKGGCGELPAACKCCKTCAMFPCDCCPNCAKAAQHCACKGKLKGVAVPAAFKKWLATENLGENEHICLCGPDCITAAVEWWKGQGEPKPKPTVKLKLNPVADELSDALDAVFTAGFVGGSTNVQIQPGTASEEEADEVVGDGGYDDVPF